MPIYEYKGQQYDIATDDPAAAKSKILGYLDKQAAPAQVPTQGERTLGETGFIPSVIRGGRGIASLASDIVPAMLGKAVGADEYAKKQLQEAAAYQQETQKLYPAEVASYKDVDSVGKALTYIKEAIGEAIPSIIPSIFTGGLAGIAARPAMVAAQKTAQDFAAKQVAQASAKNILTTATIENIKKEALDAGVKQAQKIAFKYQSSGALAGSAAQNIPDVYQNIYEATGKEDLGAALAFGSFNAALDAITPISLLRKMSKSGIGPEEVMAAWYKRAGKGAAQGFVTEGGTEALQEVSSAAAEKFVDSNQQFFSQKNLERVINSGLKGGFGGGAITAATNVAFGKNAQTPPPPAGTQQQTPEQKAQILRPLEEIEKAEVEKVTQELLNQNFPEDNARSIAVRRVIENRKKQAREAVIEPAQNEVEQRVKELIDAGVDPKLASIQAPEQIAAEKEADALAQSENQGAENAGQPITAPSGTSTEVASAANQGPPAAGIEGDQRLGMVSTEQDVTEPDGRKAAEPASVVDEPTLVEEKQAPADEKTAPTEVLTETPAPDEQAALQAELADIQNADPDEQAFIKAQVDEVKVKRTRAKGAGRKPLPAEEKTAKETKRKEGRAKYQAAERKFSQNKEGALNQLDEANTPLDEGEFADEEALAQAQEDKRAQKVAAINQLLDIEEAHRGTALGKRAKAVLNDRTKISQVELDKAKKGREVRKNTNTQELMGGVNDYVSPSEGTYTTGPKYSASRKNTPRAVNPQLTGVMNGAQALTIIAKTGSWFQKLLANRLRAFVPNLRIVVLEKGQDLPARLTRASENPEGTRPWNGLFLPGKDPVIYITGASFGKSNGQNNITVLHEILHAVLNNRLGAGLAGLDAKAAQFAKQITNLARIAGAFYKIYSAKGLVSKELRARVESTKIGVDANGDPIYEIFDSPDEFLAYAMTEDVIQDFLRIVPSLQTTKVVFSDFVNSAAKLLGLGKGKNGEVELSALTDIIDATDKLLAVPLTDAQLKAADEAIANQPSRSVAPKEPEKPPVPQASVIPDDMKDPVRAAAELKKDTDKAIETVAVSRAGEEGRGIEMMQMARDPEKALPILQALVERKWLNMSNAAIQQLVKMPTMTFLAKWSGIRSLQDVDSHMQSMLGMSNSLQAAAGDILKSFKKELNPLFKGAKEFRTDFENLVYTSTVARVDPSNPKAKEKDARVTALYNKVGPKGQEMYRQLKQYYENLVDLYSDLLDDQVKAIQGMTPAAKENLMKVLRQTFETGARISPYFPLVRRGDYWLRISEKVGKETVQAFYMFESVGERDQYAAQLAAEKLDSVENMKDNGTLDMDNTVASLRATTYASSDMLTEIFDAIDQEKFDSPQAKEALKDAIYQVYLNTMPEQKFRSQFIHRKDRAGFSTDVLRNIGTTAASTSIHLAKLKYSPLLRNALSAANDVAKTSPYLSPFVTEAKERVALALEGGKPGLGDAVAGVANKTSFFWFLSGASSALIQPASIYISALPILAANHNNAIAAGKELGKMLTYINQYSVTRENPDGTTSLVAPSIVNNKSLSDLERNAIRQMSQRGVTQSTYASEVYGYKSIPTTQASTVLGKTKELGAEAADLLVGSLMHNTERLTREAVYLASYRLGVKRGLSHDAAINQAVDDVNESLGNYDVTNRPRFMQQGIGKVLTQFKMFPLHVTMIMATNFVKMLPILNKEGKKAAATKFFGTYLTAGSIAGLAGIPAFSSIAGVITEVMKAIQGEDADDELKDLDANTYLRYVLLPEKLGHIMIGDVSLADLLGSGVANAITGTAIGERVGVNDLWGRDTKEAKTNREGMLAYVTDKMGPSVSLGLSVADAFDAFAVGDDVKAWDKLSPAAIRNIRYAMRLADEGIKDSKGNEVVPADDISTGRFIAQVIGFRPEEVARMADINYRLTGAQIKIQNEQTRLMTSAKVAIRSQDDKGFDKFEQVMEDIDKFNERHPTFPIDTGQVMDSIAEDMQKRSEAQFGINVDEKNAVFSERVIDYLYDRLEREAKARKK